MTKCHECGAKITDANPPKGHEGTRFYCPEHAHILIEEMRYARASVMRCTCFCGEVLWNPYPMESTQWVNDHAGHGEIYFQMVNVIELEREIARLRAALRDEIDKRAMAPRFEE